MKKLMILFPIFLLSLSCSHTQDNRRIASSTDEAISFTGHWTVVTKNECDSSSSLPEYRRVGGAFEMVSRYGVAAIGLTAVVNRSDGEAERTFKFIKLGRESILSGVKTFVTNKPVDELLKKEMSDEKLPKELERHLYLYDFVKIFNFNKFSNLTLATIDGCGNTYIRQDGFNFDKITNKK